MAVKGILTRNLIIKTSHEIELHTTPSLPLMVKINHTINLLIYTVTSPYKSSMTLFSRRFQMITSNVIQIEFHKLHVTHNSHGHTRSIISTGTPATEVRMPVRTYIPYNWLDVKMVTHTTTSTQNSPLTLGFQSLPLHLNNQHKNCSSQSFKTQLVSASRGCLQLGRKVSIPI